MLNNSLLYDLLNNFLLNYLLLLNDDLLNVDRLGHDGQLKLLVLHGRHDQLQRLDHDRHRDHLLNVALLLALGRGRAAEEQSDAKDQDRK